MSNKDRENIHHWFRANFSLRDGWPGMSIESDFECSSIDRAAEKLIYFLDNHKK